MNTAPIKAGWGYLENLGAIGVDVFFVISGFIMAFISNGLKGKNDAKKFLLKRFARVYPLYILLTFILIAINLPSLSVIAKDILLIPFFDRGNLFIPLTINVAWSLSFELFFYVLMFMLILFSRGRQTAIAIIGLLILSTIGSIFLFKDIRLQFLFNPIMLEFVFGIIIFQLFLKYQKTVGSTGIYLLLLAMLLFVMLVIFGYGDISEVAIGIFGNKGLMRVLLWGVPSALLVAGFVLVETKKTNCFQNKLLNMIGDASYSIYLTHFILFKFVLAFLLKDIKLNGDLLTIFVFIAAIIIGILVFYFVEKPLLRITNRLLKQPTN